MPYADPREAKARRLERYRQDPDLFRRRSAERYAADPGPARERARVNRERAQDAEQGRDREREQAAARLIRTLRETVPEPVPYEGDVSWQQRAGCLDLDPELFFARHVGSEVRAACLACPVRAECLGMALAFPGLRLHGYWGGTTHHERARLRQAGRERDSDVTEQA